MERVLGCVQDYLEGAQSKILRCAIAVSTNIPENHEKKSSNTTHIKKLRRQTDTMANYSAFRNAIDDYMSNGPTEEVHEIPPPERLNQIGLGINGLGNNIEDLTGRVVIKRGWYAELLEEEQQGKKYRADMIDREDNADEIKCLTADLGVALVKERALRETVKSVLADRNDGAQTVCAGTKGQVQEYVSCAIITKSKCLRLWGGKEYMEYARYATLLRQYQEDHDTVRVEMITNEFDDSWKRWRLRNPLHKMY